MPTQTSSKVIQLRQLLSEKFPEAHADHGEAHDTFGTGVSALDRIGIPQAELTELVGECPSAGCASLVAALIESAQTSHHHITLIDGSDGFDPQSITADARRNLLWIRCRGALEGTKAADLILRDGNLSFVILDLRANPVREVRRLGSSIWYRLQTLSRHSSITCMVLTPIKVVSSARLRLTIDTHHTLKDLDRHQGHLLTELPLKVNRRRDFTSNLDAAETG